MIDSRLTNLAEQLIEHSVSLKKGEHILINCGPDDKPLVKELVRAVYAVGGYPHVSITDQSIQRCVVEGLQAEQADVVAAYETAKYDQMDAYIRVATASNPMEYAGVCREKLELNAKMQQQSSKKIKEGKTKWCVCVFPTNLYASAAGMSLDDFEDYYFSVCCMDYANFGRAMEKLRLRMESTDKVRVVAPGTDLTFSIRGVAKCVSAGERNIPDGEVYTAPVRDSVNGTIMFNVPSIYEGLRFDNICLTFEHGKAVVATASNSEKLNHILNVDEGARYVGEFAFGLNPKLTVPLGITLFDEKICGSIHLAMGHALDLTDNGNRSVIHWDMVALHTPQMGGGCIFFDDVLIRENGEFIPSELLPLNSQNF